MNSNLKFRVFCNETKKWKYFEFMELVQGWASKIWHYLDNATWQQSTIWHYLDNATWQQSTGLKDEYGDEIYEGDIVKMHVDTNFVHVMLGYSQPEPVFRNYLVVRVPAENNQPERLELKSLEPEPTYVETGSKQMKIIGNIHQNPELVKEFNK